MYFDHESVMYLVNTISDICDENQKMQKVALDIEAIESVCHLLMTSTKADSKKLFVST